MENSREVSSLFSLLEDVLACLALLFSSDEVI
jgi:hypothetical protein